MSSNEITQNISSTNTTIPECSNACSIGGCCDCCCCKGGQALCIAKSKCATNIIPPVSSSSVSFTIPTNSCITKIYASMPNAPTSAKYILIEIIDGDLDRIFCHGVPNTGNDDPEFDTTLVQPLCVRAPISGGDATIKVTALNQSNSPINAELTLTVVFCPDCC